MSETTVRERPLIMSAEMVRAVLRGTKTQTRRVITNLNPTFVAAQPTAHQIAHAVRCPYGGIGDRLWVREAWQHLDSPCADEPLTVYRATDAGPNGESAAGLGWRPSIHMPRWASRLTLEITDVRVERVQSITESDALAEGIASATKDGTLYKYGLGDADGLPGGAGWPWYEWEVSPRDAFARLWDALNAPRGHGWDVNPWAWIISFQRVEPSHA